MNREQAEIVLKDTFGFDHFHNEQWETIDLLFKGKRVALIEKTGFGKSLCYQFPATQFDGLTVIFSPLIALMRDQVRGLNEKGVSARFINSEQSPEQNKQTIQDAIDGKVKILYIAPERQENQEWIEATRKMNLSMVVIDEAHTISAWGHDFRPAFRRIISLVKLLPQNLPVLATTATATKRVQNDIEQQISGEITTIRGSLIRENFELYVMPVSHEDEKLLWLAEQINSIDGTGIIYTGTRVNTEIYAKWLSFMGISSTAYHAGLDAESRKEVEMGLMANKWKVVISTNALGMGIDKPDLRFIVHTQIPASPIHYYQEIGRAGRDGKPTKLILFYNNAMDKNGHEIDVKLPKSFIDSGRPSIENYQKVLAELKREPMAERQLMKATDLKQTQIRVIKADLIEQGIVKEVLYGRSKKFEYQFNAPEINTDTFEQLRTHKLAELTSMLDYVNHKESRMKFLCDYLGDTSVEVFQNCDNTTLSPFIIQENKANKQKLQEFRESLYPELTVESKSTKFVNGVAASYYSSLNVGAAINRSKYEKAGDFPDFLMNLTLKAYRKRFRPESVDLIMYVPPTESGDLVKRFAEKLANIVNVPISHNLVKKAQSKPQNAFKNVTLKNANVANIFNYLQPSEIKGKNIILFDDIFDTGATIKEIGKVLSKLGAKNISPLVIAKTTNGDI
jgi:ATP-dependent DNA helicase RecQ